MNSNYEHTTDAVCDADTSLEEAYGIRIEEGALVLPSGCTMPLQCIKTNQPVSERDMILTNLSWCPQSTRHWGLLGPLPLIFAYFVGREHCLITYGLVSHIRYRNTFRTVAKILATVALLAATILLAVSPSTHWLIGPSIAVAFVLFLASVVVVFIGNSPLYIVDYRDGMFWIKGFSKEYLDELDL